MAQQHACDICVIGAGSGGLSVAAAGSQMGARVVLVERSKMGGECLNNGCVPSKALLAAAARGVSFAEAHDHVRNVIAEIAPHDSEERFAGLGVRVIREHARFTGPRTVAAGEHTIRARRFVVATGSLPVVPGIAGLDATPHLTNETLFEARPEPDHLIVLGGGPVGIEMAQAFRRLGSRVSVIEAAHMLGNDDPELTDVLRSALLAEGVDLLEGCGVRRAEGTHNGVALTCAVNGTDRRIEGSHLLVATGRKPNIDGLDLEKAGVTTGDAGIVIDRRLRTANRRIFALGDVVGPYRFTHMASYQAGVVLRNALFRLPAKVDYKAVPWITYTDPELGHVGLTEAAARDAHGAIRILRWPYCENDRAVAEGRTEGLIKVITTANGRVVGASIVGAYAGELILPWSFAVRRRLKISAMLQAIVPYPTYSGLTSRVAANWYVPKLLSERTRRIVRLLARLG